MKISIYSFFVSFALSSYILTNLRPGGSSKVCLSNTTSDKTLIEYWERLESPSGEHINRTRSCRLGDAPYSFSTSRNIRNLIKEVQKSPSEMTLECNMNEEGTETISLRFDALSGSDHIQPSSIDCDTGEVIAPVRSTYRAVEKKIPDQDSSTPAAAVMTVPAVDLEYERKIKDLEVQLANVKIELLSEREQVESIKANLQNQVGLSDNAIRSADDIIRKKNEEIRSLQLSTRNLDHEINKLKNSHGRLEEDLREERRAKHEMNRSLQASFMTTVIPVVTTIALLSDVALAARNDWIHSKNRPGGSSFKLQETDEQGCKSMDYASSCPGFEYMLMLEKYPFFNSHIHHYSLLEAYNEKIITKADDGICTLNDSKSSKCHEEKVFMRAQCPNSMQSAHYIDSKGKLRAVVCPDGAELSEDCNHCRKTKKKSGGSIVHKSSVSMQDAICQKNTEDYTGPKIIYKSFCKVGTQKLRDCKSTSKNTESVPFIVFNGRGKMYLESLIIRNNDGMGAESFICYSYKGQIDGSDKTEQEYRLLKSEKASECKNVNSQKTNPCTGDPVFCDRYTCTGEYPEVKCLYAPGSGPVEVMVMGEWVKPMCLGYERIVVWRDLKTQIITPEEPCVNCISECRDDGVMIRSPGFLITSAVACSHGSCSSVAQDPSTQIVLDYPGITASAGGTIGVHMSHDDKSVSSSIQVSCKPRDQCDAHHCWFCLTSIVNYQCHTVMSTVITVSGIILLSYAGLRLVLMVLYKLKVLPKQLSSPLKWLLVLGRWMVKVLRWSIISRVNSLNARIGWINEQDNRQQNHRIVRRQDLEEVVVPRLRPLVPILRYGPLSILFFMMILSGAESCSQNEIANSKMVRCRLEGGKTKCTISGSVVMKAGVIGSESCLEITGRGTDQKTLISVKTVSSELVCREGTSFWTGQYTPECLSSRRCHLVSECKSNNCQSWTDDKVSLEFGNLKDSDFMTENKCIEQCGGIGCGCFNVNPSCLFVHTRLVPTRKEAIKVFNCIEWTHRITLEIRDSNHQTFKVVLSDLNTKFLPWGSISLSIDSESVISTNSLTFLYSSSGGYAMLDENFSEIPREGFIGEIRCNSEQAAMSAHKSCLSAPNLVKYKPLTDQVECTSSLVDPFAVFLRGALPQHRNGMTFTSSIDKRSVQAFSNGQIRANIQLLLDDYEVVFNEEVIECDAVFLNLTGCYSCNSGALVCLKVDTKKSAILRASAEGSDLKLGLHVTPEIKEYCQVLHFKTPGVDENLMYSCGSVEKPIRIVGTLIYISQTTGRNTTGGLSTVINPTESGWSITSWLSGFISWMGGPLKAILMTLLYVAVSAVIIFILVVGVRFFILKTLSKLKKNN
ncbi:polyprotein [Urucuri virus]|uniref:Envelopment polyprotein n=1 Tax=Urucuri virus TaxID=1926502 RepID=A0A1S5SHW8_9VIRU|nr:polyprotein [Urucuri virus]API68901.1 polyprotein [Urucuri virus]